MSVGSVHSYIEDYSDDKEAFLIKPLTDEEETLLNKRDRKFVKTFKDLHIPSVQPMIFGVGKLGLERLQFPEPSFQFSLSFCHEASFTLEFNLENTLKPREHETQSNRNTVPWILMGIFYCLVTGYHFARNCYISCIVHILSYRNCLLLHCRFCNNRIVACVVKYSLLCFLIIFIWIVIFILIIHFAVFNN